MSGIRRRHITRSSERRLTSPSLVTEDGRPTYNLCAVPITALAPCEAAETIVKAGTERRALEVHLCNAYTLSLLDRDPVLSQALRSADLNLPDGAPVAWFGRHHGTIGPVRGPALLVEVVRLGVESDLRHYFYGGASGVGLDLVSRLKEDVPGLEIAGVETPPYHDLDEHELCALCERIRISGSQIVWIGIGTPRQDYLVPRLAGHLDMPIVPVGAAFDFLAGRVKQAPVFLHGTGLEWLHRLYAEPGRLWRRYLIGNPRFLLNVVRLRRVQ